jgi:ribosomal RNA-processing protein 12
MIIDEGNDDELSVKEEKGRVAGKAYRENITSADGFTLGPAGRVKFNKNTKKRRRESDDADNDVDMEDVSVPAVKGKKEKRRSEDKVGHEFKAKVSRVYLFHRAESYYLYLQKAEGDVKRGSIDPYAYVPLATAAKKTGRGGHGRIGIAGKRKRS